jgi:hypothetical protein
LGNVVILRIFEKTLKFSKSLKFLESLNFWEI